MLGFIKVPIKREIYGGVAAFPRENIAAKSRLLILKIV